MKNNTLDTLICGEVGSVLPRSIHPSKWSALKLNPLNAIDFYKTGHVVQYPLGTTEVYSNFTARSDRLAPVLRAGPAAFDGKVVFFGLQGFIKSFLIATFNDGFFNIPKQQAVRAYKRRLDTSLGLDAVDVSHIAALHDLGYLPLEVKALPEGSRVNIKVPFYTLRSTLDDFYWLTNYLETVFSSDTWKQITVATIAYQYRRLLEHFADATGADQSFVDWQAHDFSARGLSGAFDAMVTGSAHLLSFTGTDSVSAIDYLEQYYNANADTELIGGSVPATEHSVMSMGGALDELQTYRRLITEVYPDGIISIVSDTWDFWRVITEYTETLKAEILARRPNAMGQAKVVFRPDSGNPVHILTGYVVQDVDSLDDDAMLGLNQSTEAVQCGGRFYLFEATTEKSSQTVKEKNFSFVEIRKAEAKGAVECLWDIFGGTMTAKGYKVLNDRVGLIYGDSITLERAWHIMQRLMDKGFASTNTVLGVGSFSYQFLTRDCFGMAMKATSGVVNGERRELFKDPVTDNGTKKSARGLLRVEKEGDDFVLYDQQTTAQEGQGCLETVFCDGVLLRDESLADIRARLRA